MFVVALALLILGAIVSAVLSGLETVLLILKEHRIQSIAEEKPSLKHLLGNLQSHPELHLTQVLTLGSVVNLTTALSALYLLHQTGWLNVTQPLLWARVGGLVVFAAFVLDFVPKQIALRRPWLICRIAARPLLVLTPLSHRISQPLLDLSHGITQRLLAWLRIAPQTGLREEEIETMIELQAARGALTTEERDVITEVLRLGQKTLRDCITPRGDLLVLSEDLPPDEILRQVRGKNGQRFVPVFKESLDHITAVLDACSLLRDPDRPLSEHLRVPLFLPETTDALEAFSEHLRHPDAIAVVLDEHGGLEGTVGHRDLIGEILSIPEGNNDPQQEIRVLRDGRLLLVRGSARLDEIGAILDLDLEKEGIDTIGGLAFTEMGRLPLPDEAIAFHDINIRVRKMGEHRIDELLIEKTSRKKRR